MLHQINPKCDTLEEVTEEVMKKMYEMMFKVTYDPSINFVCQTSFTYLDWRIAEKILENPDFNFGDVNQNQCMEMSFCIFP